MKTWFPFSVLSLVMIYHLHLPNIPKSFIHPPIRERNVLNALFLVKASTFNEIVSWISEVSNSPVLCLIPQTKDMIILSPPMIPSSQVKWRQGTTSSPPVPPSTWQWYDKVLYSGYLFDVALFEVGLSGECFGISHVLQHLSSTKRVLHCPIRLRALHTG